MVIAITLGVLLNVTLLCDIRWTQLVVEAADHE